MEELSGPVVGIALVLASVFVPTAFIPGITGRLYQQFALTIAISVILSALQCAHAQPGARWSVAATKIRGRRPQAPRTSREIFWTHSSLWERSTNGFVRWSHAVIRKGALVMVLLVLFGLGAFFFGNRLPSQLYAG